MTGPRSLRFVRFGWCLAALPPLALVAACPQSLSVLPDECSGGRVDCANPVCAGLSCGRGGTCANGRCEREKNEATCDDGLDNDGDSLADCPDPDCRDQKCSDGDACTINEVCRNGACNGGSAVTCDAPPECRVGPGTCSPDAGCTYERAAAGTKCSSGFCGADGVCRPLSADGGFPYVPSNFDPRAFVPPTSPLVLSCVATFDSRTSTGYWCGQPGPTPVTVPQDGGGPVVVLPLAGLVVNDGGLRLTGDKPVILAVYGDAFVVGFIEADATGRDAGPGGADCAASVTMMGQHGNGRGGGGGGAGFGTPGADGGAGGAALAMAGVGGLAAGDETLIPLRGGCMGGNGGSRVPPTVGTGGRGGGGGGGVQLSVAGTLTLRGHVSARGGGGLTTSIDEGGAGGGGSGGGILLEANVLDLAGSAVTANGGGGGSGNAAGSTGRNGADGDRLSAIPAPGGQATGAAGGGGSGGAGTTLPRPGGSVANLSDSGGGGGGGAVGRIRLNAATRCALSGATISPPATSNKAGSSGCP